MIIKVCSNFISNNNSMEDHIARSFGFFRTRSLPWLAALVTFVAFALCLGLGFLSIFLSSSALILCPIIFTLTLKPNSSLIHNNQILRVHQDQALSSSITHEKFSSEIEEEEEEEEEVVGSMSDYQSEIVNEEAGNWIEEAHVSDSLLRTSEQQLSDTESTTGCSTVSHEDYEIEWSSRDNSISTNITARTQDQRCSDGSISDEESLIEIALPAGHYVEPGKVQQEPSNGKYSYFQQKRSGCPMEFLFGQQSLTELLADQMNEENLIEIDITMGSIKCPRFEIKT